MGLTFRKRTKGKNTWVNISASKKNGIGFSLSGKIAKGVTVNWKPGRGFRTTLSVPGTGVRWVSSTAKQKSTRSKRNQFSDYTSKAQERAADADFAAREARHDELVEMHNALIARIAEIDNECRDIVNAQYAECDYDMPEAQRAELVAIVDAFEEERAALMQDDIVLEQRMSDECRFQVPKEWRDKRSSYFFRTLRAQIQGVDSHIDWYRERHWTDDDLLRIRTRRLGYVVSLKNHVEENAISAANIQHMGSVLDTMRIFAPMASVIFVAAVYAVFIK